MGDRAGQSHNPLAFQFSTQGPLLRATHRGPWSLPQTSSPPRPEIIFLLQWVPCLLRTTLSTPHPHPHPHPACPWTDGEKLTERPRQRQEMSRGRWANGAERACPTQGCPRTSHTRTHTRTHTHRHTHTSPGPAAQRPLSVNGLEATCRATRIPQCPRALAAHRDPRARRVGGWQGPRATRSMACRHDLCPEPVSAWADSSGRLPGPPSQPLGLPAALCGRDLSCGLRTPGPPRTRVPPFLCPGNPSEAFGARQAGGGPAFLRSVLPDAEAAGAGPCLGPQPEKVCLAPGDHPARVRPPPPPGPRRPWGAGTEPAGSCLSCVRVLGAQACHPLAAEAQPPALR